MGWRASAAWACGLLAIPGAGAAEPALIRAADGSAVAPGAAAIAAPALLRLAAGESTELLGHRVTATSAARIYVVVSSDFVKWSQVSGEARVDAVALSPGEVALTPVGGGKTRRARFDAARLAAAAPPGIAGELGDALVPVVAAQRRQRFMGTLAARQDARSPAVAALEQVRRGYLADPRVVALRGAAGGDAAALRLGVARFFAVALARGDRAGVAALLDPAPFLVAGSGWERARDGFAGNLIGRVPAAAAPVAVRADGDAARLEWGGRAYRLRFADRGAMPFVAALEPQS